jgi:hypothetical protein
LARAPPILLSLSTANMKSFANRNRIQLMKFCKSLQHSILFKRTIQLEQNSYINLEALQARTPEI